MSRVWNAWVTTPIGLLGDVALAAALSFAFGWDFFITLVVVVTWSNRWSAHSAHHRIDRQDDDRGVAP